MFLQKAMSFGAIVDKDRLQRGFNAKNYSLVNIAVGNFPRTAFDMEIFEFVFFDLGNSAFFRVDRINQNFNIHIFFPVVAPIGQFLKISTISKGSIHRRLIDGKKKGLHIFA
jgi:hypothetical protein